MKKIMVIPDTQVKPGVPTNHLACAGRYAAAKKPDVVVVLADWWDMPSLSSYDRWKKSFEGRRVVADIKAGKAAMEEFLAPIRAEQAKLVANHKERWNPRLVFTLGNHENRINRAVEMTAEYEGLLGIEMLGLEEFGFEVYDFLEVVVIEGVAFSHYFTSGVMGRPVSNAKQLLDKKHMSCVMGHVQDRNIAYAQRADGKQMTGLFAGIFYQHDENYLTPQTNGSWRGIWMLHGVSDGSFDEMPVSLEYLLSKYGA